MAKEDIATSARTAISLLDLTSLGDGDTVADIDALCDAARTPEGPVAAVCVWPRFVGQAVGRLRGSPIGVAAVANFPEGDPDVDRAVGDARAIVAAGGTEVDVVIPWRSLIAGDEAIASLVLVETRAALDANVTMKVILETGELMDPALIRVAADIALQSGADFLKTSTGKTAYSATPEAARVMLEAIAANESKADRSCGLKISGGVRTLEQAQVYLQLAADVMGNDWVTPATFRFGASSLLNDLLAVLKDQPRGESPSSY